MNKRVIAINYIVKHCDGVVKGEDISSESNIFEFNELDYQLLPSKYMRLFEEQTVLLDVYMYQSIFVYFISLLKSPKSGCLIGVGVERRLLEYKYLKEGDCDF